MNLLSTQRLGLRPFTLDDASLLHQLHSDARVMQYIPCGVRTLAETHIDIQNDIKHQEKYGFSKWAVFSRESGDFVGRAGWAWIESGEVEVGFKFLPHYWDKGLATEVLQALLLWGKTHISFPLIGFAYPENIASLRVMKKTGMVYVREDEYEGKKIIVYAI